MNRVLAKDNQENERRLREGAQSYGQERRRSPAREGAALLQGIVICDLCGRRMTVRYRTRSGRNFPDYRCQRESIDACAPECQSIPGARIDEVIGGLLLATMTPVALVTVHLGAGGRFRTSELRHRSDFEKASISHSSYLIAVHLPPTA
jgi:hypothetical protein